MSEAFWIALLVGVGSPALLAMLTNWNKSRERAEDRAERKALLDAAKDTNTGIATLGTKVDGMLVDRDKKNIQEGERKGAQAGADKAAVLAEGQRQGREERGGHHNGDSPLPVADDRTAIAAERSATATERVATAAEDSSLSKKT